MDNNITIFSRDRPGSPLVFTSAISLPIDKAQAAIARLGQELNAPGQITDFLHDIQSVDDVQLSLTQILAKCADVFKNSQTGDAALPHSAKLGKELHQLEERLNQLSVENSLNDAEVKKLQELMSQIQAIVGSLGQWEDFLQSYFKGNEQRECALGVMTPTLFSNLHGCSIFSLHGLNEGVHLQGQQISGLTNQLNKPNHPFASFLWSELFGCIHSTCWNLEDWCHEVSKRSENVFKQALGLWDKAITLIEKEEAATLLISQLELINGLEELLTKMQKELEGSFIGLPSAADSDKYRQMQKQTKMAIESLKKLQAEVPTKAQKIRDSLSERNFLDNLEKARALADTREIDEQVAKIVSGYHPIAEEEIEAAVDRYINIKRELMGLVRLSPAAKSFCQREEVRLTALNGFAIDFEGMAQAMLLKEKEPSPGLMGRLFQKISFENWSDTTRARVRTFFDVMQLTHQALNIYQQLPVRESSLNKDQQQAIDKEVVLLRNLLTQKYEFLGSKSFDDLTRKSPEIRESLLALLAHRPASSGELPKELYNEFMNAYQTYRENVELGQPTAPPNEWVSKLAYLQTPTFKATVLTLPDRPNLTEVVNTAMENLVSATTEAQRGSEQLQNAAQSLAQRQTLVEQCSYLEYMQLKSAVTPKELHELRKDIALMQASLRSTMLAQPQSSAVPEWDKWNSQVKEQCFAVKDLEKRIASSMAKYEEAVALHTLQQAEERQLEGFGNKHLNLIKQENLQKALEMEGINIPVPVGVENRQVNRFLQGTAPEIFEHWKTLGRLYGDYKGTEPFLKTAEATQLLKTIASAIEHAFSVAGTDDAAFHTLGLKDDVLQWLDQLAAQGDHLMVRSTGAEDSKKSANAGGNLSVAYVKPTRAEFCAALGQVVASYFGAGSLQNRLNADNNPFEEDLKLAVTAQKLIGEPIGGAVHAKDIPISLVLFSNEPLYYGDEEFRAMRISATYGHGEGVVGNQGIGSDTILVLQSVANPDKILYMYDAQSKPERLAPVADASGKVSLQKIANPPELANAHVLTPELILKLYEWGVVGEKFFGDFPTDMEIVIKNGKIYPVQARPIVRPAVKSPTFVDPKKLVNAPVIETLKLKPLVSGKSSVVELSKPEELQTADTLEKAESQFDKKFQKMVVVGKSEPANSHPVVNFSGMGIPCLWTPTLAAAQEMAKKITDTEKVVVCVQSAKMFLLDTSKGPISDYVSEGYVVHPAQIALSVPVKAPVAEDSRVSQELPEELHDNLFRFQTAVSREAALKELQQIRSSATLNEFHKKMTELEKITAEEPLAKKHIASTLAAAKAIDVRIEQTFGEIEALLTQSTPYNIMELLLHAKILSALLFQTKETSSGIAQHSVATLNSAFAAADILIAYQRQLGHPAQFADLLMDGTQSPTESFFAEWQDFLLEMEKEAAVKTETSLSQEISDFKLVMQTMRRTNTLPFFATFLFNNPEKGTPLETMRAINRIIPSSEAPRILQLLSHADKITQIEKDVGLFSDPKASPEALKRLQETIAPFLPPQNAWMEKWQWDALSPITRTIAIQTLNNLVNVYDLSIKATKLRNIRETEKEEEVKKMLHPFLDLLESWATNTVGPEGFVTHPYWPLDRYLKTIRGWLDNPVMSSLMPSGVSVSAGMLGAGTDFQRHYPSTVEDIFTLIHQNLLATTEVLLKNTVSTDQIKSAPLPDPMKLFLDNINKIEGNEVDTPQLIGVETTAQQIILRYNVPLRNHSGKLVVYYDRKTGKLTMESQFLGQARDRWGKALERAQYLNMAEILPFAASPKLTPEEISLSWDVSNKQAMLDALEEYRIVAEESMKNSPFSQQEILNDFVDKIIANANLQNLFNYVFKSNLDAQSRSIANRLADHVLSIPNHPLQNNPDLKKLLIKIDHEATFSIVHAKAINQDLTPLLKNTFFEHISRGLNEELILDLTQIALQSGNKDIVDKAFAILETFIAEEKSLDHVYAILKDIIVNGRSNYYYDTNEKALYLFKELFKQGKGIEEASEVVKMFFVSQQTSFPEILFNLISTLAEYGYMLDEAIKAAQIVTESSSELSKKGGFNLFITLVEKGKGIEEAIEAAKKAFRAFDISENEWSLKLFLVLVNHGYAKNEAIEAAKKSFFSNWYFGKIHKPAYSILIKLLEQGIGIDDAIEAAEATSGSRIPEIQKLSDDLYSELNKNRSKLNYSQTAKVLSALLIRKLKTWTG